MDKKFCKFCGEKISSEAVICPKCGRQVEELKKNDNTPIIINNSSSSSSSAAASAVSTSRRRKKHYSLPLDILLICCTGGLWIIWMVVRPKYY